MNKINVLYQNLKFKKSGECNIQENLDAPIFASDETLSDLLRKASIAKFDKRDNNESGKNEASNFKKHPRLITDDSLVSVNEHENPLIDTLSNNSQIDTIIRKVTFKRHVKLETTEKSLSDSITNNPDCQLMNTKNMNITEKKIKECLKSITGRHEIDEPKQEIKKVPKTEVQEDFLGVKLKSCLNKICSWLQETRTCIASKIDPLESAEDYFRRQRRAAEFGNRFNRNYLYQLSRQLIELRRHTQKPSSCRPGAPNTARALTNACQTVLQAVQAYCNHIPTTISIRGSTEGTVHAKFCEFLKDTCDLCRIVKKLGCIYYDVATSLSLIEEIETNCKSLIILVEETFMKKCEIENKPLPKPKPTPKRKKHFASSFHNINPVESRFSMYSVPFKKTQKTNPNWKKNAEKLAHQRFNVQSRYKNPRLPPTSEIETKSNIHVATENKRKSIAAKKSSHQSDSASVVSTEPVAINEEEIPTLVEMDYKKSTQDIVSTSGEIRSRIEPLLQSLVAEVSAGKEQDLLGQGVYEDMLLKLHDLLSQVQHPAQNSSPNKPEKKHNLPKNRVSITGPKNAKLICVKDKSLFESKTELKTSLCRLEEPLPQPKSLSMLPALERKLSRKLTTSNSQTMANLSKQCTINIIQYKINFHKYTKPLMMYRKSSQVLPWILTGKITDSLFEHLINSVVSEINIDGLAKKLYQSEFETCC